MPNKQRNTSGRPSPMTTTPAFSNRIRSILGRGGGIETHRPSVLDSATFEVSGSEIPVARSVEHSVPPLLEATLVDDTMADADATTTSPIILTQPTLTDDHMNTEPDLTSPDITEIGYQNGTQAANTPHRVITQQSTPPTPHEQATTGTIPASSLGRFFQENQVVPNLQNPADVYNGPSLPPPVIPEPHCPYFGRYIWKNFIPKLSSPFPTLVRSIQEVWDALHESDPSLIIYPWREDAARNPSLALHRVDDCPTTKEVLARYFQKAFPKAEGGSFHIGVCMGHDLSERQLRQKSSEFFTTTNRDRLGFWYRGLQHDEVTEVGRIYFVYVL